MGGDLARWFERFRDRGEVAALAEVFDRAAPELLRVALHLARDPAEAEDLVQTTFLAAIEHGARFDARRPLLPWLVGILHNQAGLLRRRQRPLDPARLAVRANPTPPEAAARREEAAELRKALDGLADPYRQVLILRLRHGLAPAEIADVLGRAPGTIRAQLHRGLTLLRRALPAGLAPLFFCGVAAERGLAAVRDAVLDCAAARVVPTAAATTAAGGLLMKKAVTALLALALLATGVTLVARNDRRDVAPDRAASVRPPSAEVPPGAATESAAAGAARTPEPAARGATLHLRTLREEDDAPVPHVLVMLNPQVSGSARAMRTTVRTDERGLQTVDDVAPGRLLLTTDRQGYASLTVEAGATVDVPIRIRRGFDIVGVVVDARGVPVSALVCLAPPTDFWLREPVLQTGPDGRFTLHDLWNRTWLSARAPGRAPSGTYELQAGPGGRVEVTLTLPGLGGAIAGEVRDQGGEPVEGAPVVVSTRRGPGSGYPQRDASGFTYTDGPVNFLAHTDAQGHFAVDGLAPGEAIVLVKDGFHAPWHEETQVEEGRTTSLLVRLDRGAELCGTVRDAAGTSLSGAQVDVLVETPVVSCYASARTEKDGAYRIKGCRPAPLRPPRATPIAGRPRAGSSRAWARSRAGTRFLRAAGASPAGSSMSGAPRLADGASKRPTTHTSTATPRPTRRVASHSRRQQTHRTRSACTRRGWRRSSRRSNCARSRPRTGPSW